MQPSLALCPLVTTQICPFVLRVSAHWTGFLPPSRKELTDIIRRMPKKSCSLDPIPASVLRDNLHSVLPALLYIVRCSLQSGIFPAALKTALVTPLLKRPGLDLDVLGHYRPVSNLAFLGKVIEKVVAARLISYMESHGLGEPMQSRYKSLHSTETALLRVHNDILCSLDENQAVVLVLLDLSAAFDCVDHGLLLERLSSAYGIEGLAHSWLESYLTGRTQAVKIGNHVSEHRMLQCGVPQGSVLGPILFTMYTAPIGNIVRKHGLTHHLYADDTQLYISFDPDSVDSAVKRVEVCIAEIAAWMGTNKLMLNDGKTEAVFITRRPQQLPPESTSLLVRDSRVVAASAARHLGVIFDNTMRMDKQVDALCKAAHYHLSNIGRIRHLISDRAAEQLVHAFVTARLDNGKLSSSWHHQDTVSETAASAELGQPGL